MSLSRLISISLILLVQYPTSAQFNQSIRITKYTQNDGLSSDDITKIIKDQYGFIWVGTQEGLNVFDGNSFQVFNNQSAPKRNLGGSYILDMVEDKQNSLIWVQTSFAPVTGIDLKSRTVTQVITQDDENKLYSETWGRCISLKNDLLWIGGPNTLSVWHIPSKSFLDLCKVKSTLRSQGEYIVNKITHDDFGNTWLLIENLGILVLNEERILIKTFSTDELNSKQNQENLLFWDVANVKDQIVVGTDWGVLHFKTGSLPENIQYESVPNVKLQNEPIYGLNVISDSLLLMATNSNLHIQSIKSCSYQILEDEKVGNNLLSNIYQIYYDAVLEKIWLGSRSGLMSFTLGKKPFEAISNSLDNELSLNHINSLLAKDEYSIYAVGPNGLFMIDTRSKNIELLDSTIYSWLVFQGPKDHIYVSGKNELKVFDNKRRIPDEQLNYIPDDIQGYLLNSMIHYNDSLRILGSYDNGLNIWNTNNNQNTKFPNDSIKTKYPGIMHMSNLFKSNHSEEIYILTGDAIIQFNPLNYNFDIHNIKNPISDRTLSNFMDMNEVASNYFFATYGDGLIETDKEFNVKKIYTTADGLSNNCIYKIFNIENEKVLLSTNNGLSILDLNTHKFNSYYKGDGLHGNRFEQFSGYQKNNKIYVGGPNGFTIVNTDLLSDSSVAPILFPIGIEINTPDGKIDSTHLFMSSFTIPNDAFKTTLNFVSPDFKNPQRMVYRYKIKELSKDWVDLGNQNFVDLIGINPGTYHFEVQATNARGMDSEPLEIKLDFLPKWYQTHWFKLIMLLAVALLIYFIQRYRMIQIKKQQQIRTEIANDLHDDIGSTLNSLKIFTHLAQSDQNNGSHLLQIEKSITNATAGLRDMIWVLEDEQDSAYELMDRIKKFGQPVCLVNNIELVTNLNADSDQLISKKIKRNILLIAKECINNSIKYAECTNIQVILEHTKSNLKMSIEDNGIGFDTNNVNKGKGLESIQYRAKQIQFDCKITTETGNGTKTELSGKGG